MARESREARKARARRIIAGLERAYPDAKIALEFTTPLELLVATILSAQCTDERVNIVTRSLFQRYRTAQDYARADPAALEREIRSTGFFRSKARAIIAMARMLVDKHGGQVPADRERLTALPGVGLKTANVVLGTAFGLPTGVVVDTHVRRISQRLGLTKSQDPEVIERDLMALLPPKEWILFSHRLIWHGRRVCTARKPNCPGCPLLKHCPRVGLPALK